MNKFLKLNIILILLLSIFVISNAVLAASPSLSLNLKDAFGVNDGKVDDPLDAVAGTAGYDVKEATAKTGFNTMVSQIIQTALSLLGVIFIVLMVYGGYLWMTDRGNSEQVEKSKKLITAAIIGLIIVVSAYAISYFVLEALTSATLKDSRLETPSRYR